MKDSSKKSKKKTGLIILIVLIVITVLLILVFREQIKLILDVLFVPIGPGGLLDDGRVPEFNLESTTT